MGLNERKRYETFIRTFTAATLSEQWEAVVAKVGGKVFCLLGNDSKDLVFKVSELAFDGLVQLPGIAQAPYFAKRQWVRVGAGALEEALLRRYIRQSYEAISGKLTRKLRAELEIDV